MFGRKKTAEEKFPAPSESADSEQSFYTQRVGEEPLNEFSAGYERHMRRTSRHSPARRRETSNRAGNKEIFSLLSRSGLIVFLLVAGFFVLKLVLGKLAEPSEKEKEKWAVNDALMERGATAEALAAGAMPEISQAQALTKDVFGKRLQQWVEAERHLRSAEALEQRGIDEEAVLRLKQALRSSPDNYAAQRLLMEIYMRSGNYLKAVPLCIGLLDQDSRQWGVRKNLLQALQQLGQTEACLVLASQMLEKEPNNLDVLKMAAFAQRAAGNTEEALVLFDRMLANDSRDSAALVGSGAIYQERGDWERATPYYLELVRINSDVENYHELVRCYAQQAEAGKAVIFMGQAACLYGNETVSSWLRNDKAFVPIHETVEYRSFADQVVGVETRKAIEEIRRRETQGQQPLLPTSIDLPSQPELKLKRD